MGMLVPFEPMTAMAENLLSARNIVQEFIGRGSPGRAVRVLSSVSFDLAVGETLGIVGESGAGKSTLARALLQIPPPTSGSVFFHGSDLTLLRGRSLLNKRRHMQVVLQDPFRSLNPTWRIAAIVAEPLRAHGIGGAERRRRVAEVLDLVGLPLSHYGHRRPRELSGGQCQRIAIARALALRPALVICDEAVSSLDVLVQAQVLNLFERLRAEFGLSYIFISHDLAVVKRISDRVAVLYLGELCEIGPAEMLYAQPHHPYTADLLAAFAHMPRISADHRGESAEEEPLDAAVLTGCPFRARCAAVRERCAIEKPKLRVVGAGHSVACHFPLGANVARDRNDSGREHVAETIGNAVRR